MTKLVTGPREFWCLGRDFDSLGEFEKVYGLTVLPIDCSVRRWPICLIVPSDLSNLVLGLVQWIPSVQAFGRPAHSSYLLSMVRKSYFQSSRDQLSRANFEPL